LNSPALLAMRAPAEAPYAALAQLVEHRIRNVLAEPLKITELQ
jgi:hypothetical protein